MASGLLHPLHPQQQGPRTPPKHPGTVCGSPWSLFGVWSLLHAPAGLALGGAFAAWRKQRDVNKQI